jgi:general secretion pathway protein A
MYENYWQLKEKPFENVADPRFYYPGESHQAALLKLRYAIENRRGAALLAGPSGSGKTLLTRMLAGILGDGFGPVVRLVFPRMNTAELLAYVADEFGDAALAQERSERAPKAGGPPAADMSGELDGASCATVGAAGVQVSIRRIQQFLSNNSRQGRHAVLVIDEAHLLDSPQTFEALRLLLNIEPRGTPALTLLLVGEPALLPVIDRMPQWEERLAVKCLLRPFGEAETAAYVEHRLRVAGATRSIIDPAALSTLHALTHGIARQINRLGDLALLIGFAEEQSLLSAEHFEAVCRELVAVAA